MIINLSDIHRKVYFYSSLLLVVSLPLSIYFTSVAEIILLVNWIVEGRFGRKMKILASRKAIIIISGIYLIHLIGVLYSDFSNIDYLVRDLKIKLPLLVIPFIMGTSQAFSAKQLKTILLLFCLATFCSTLISFGVFLGVVPYEYYDFRDISIFISHIRLALMVNLSVLILFYYNLIVQRDLRFSLVLKVVSLLISCWLVFFLVLLKSLTGFVILGLVILIFTWYYSSRVENVAGRFILRTFVLVIPLIAASFITHSIGRYSYKENVDFSRLDKYTENGNLYFHDTLKTAVENGNYVWLYFSEKEVRKAWDNISKYHYDGLDKKGQRIKYTLIRYLTSKAYRKDSVGVSQLTEEDIRAIENGQANYIFLKKYSLYPRIYQVIWEVDGYLKGGDPSGHSVAQRIAYLNAAKYIFFNHPLIGVGTGDVQKSFDEYYEKFNSRLDVNYRRRAHNQYVTFLITFGIVGFIACMLCFLLPVFMEKKWHDFLFGAFFIIAFMSMLNEDTLETQTGVSFFIFFYSLFVFGVEKKSGNGHE